MVECQLCNKEFKVITNTHVKSAHDMSLSEYTEKFGSDGCGFSVNPTQLSEDDPRYQKWRKGLKNRPEVWNKGETKETHPSVKKISETFKEKEIDNFSGSRSTKKAGRNKLTIENYPEIPQNGDKAELIGCVLGDGYIYQHKRTQCLDIAGNTNNQGFIRRYKSIMEKLFNKKANLPNKGKENCTHIVLYQKFISERLNIPAGAKGDVNFSVPGWIDEDKKCLMRYLRGLYEAEGCFAVHKPTHTYKFIFSNRNQSLLDIVENSLKKLGFHPHRTKYKIQISKKSEVYECKDLLKFRQY